ncbi:hypothetical protein AB685_07370 [Bacillus sp. LL01]|uniref:site-2 protease family protein n=1 Tax=Bacillus sp. LL01 TaxID=1665556 RepID=UPI00064CE161|nr:site-2 protease family protein [Bacillus sp. LL01]KMJ58889.1 hypothetical protein AB685_07370 [Bacillus sp. LL01]
MLDTLMFFYLVVPLVHLIHEAGHVSLAKLHKVNNTQIEIGIGPKLIQFSFRGTSVRINIIPFLGGHSTNDTQGELPHRKVAWISLGGPLFNLVSVLLVIPFWTPYQFSFSTLFILFSLWIGIVNLIPFKLGEKRSDGWQIVAAIIKLVKKDRLGV